MTNYQESAMLLYQYLFKAQIMKIIKLILFALPLLLSSLMLQVDPAMAATNLNQIAIPRIELVSAHSSYATIAPTLLAKSNPIVDSIGCNCGSCVKARLQLEGKLQLSELL
jgi:hypothetical protein